MSLSISVSNSTHPKSSMYSCYIPIFYTYKLTPIIRLSWQMCLWPMISDFSSVSVSDIHAIMIYITSLVHWSCHSSFCIIDILIKIPEYSAMQAIGLARLVHPLVSRFPWSPIYEHIIPWITLLVSAPTTYSILSHSIPYCKSVFDCLSSPPWNQVLLSKYQPDHHFPTMVSINSSRVNLTVKYCHHTIHCLRRCY